MKSYLVSLALILSAFHVPHSAFCQGPLIPPGVPAPTMKTLDQVEARTPLAAGTSPININASGSYYLTGNVTISTTDHGITIAGVAKNVTIDLNGFTLAGPGSGSGAGIFLSSGAADVAIRNGTIRNWGSYGINGLGNLNVRVENVRATNNGTRGIGVDLNGVVLNCLAQGNGDAGIVGADNCQIKDSQAISNGAAGISVGARALVTGCVAVGNTNAGIAGTQGGVVSGCNSYGNGSGITGSGNCLILSNSCSDNGAGIVASGQSNRIEANNVTATTIFKTGIQVTGDNNFIIRNTARGCSPNYDIAANNKVGFIVSAPNSGAISGSTGGSGVGTSDPWANFTY
jgi:hypothetical protein